VGGDDDQNQNLSALSALSQRKSRIKRKKGLDWINPDKPRD